MLDFAFRFIILCCKVEHHFACKFHAVQFYAAIQHDSWRFILKAFDRNLTGSPNCMTMQVLSEMNLFWLVLNRKRSLTVKNWYFSMSWKTCPVKFEQTLQETSLFCWRVNTSAWPFKILRRKLKYSERTCTMWLQTILNSNILFSR